MLLRCLRALCLPCRCLSLFVCPCRTLIYTVCECVLAALCTPRAGVGLSVAALKAGGKYKMNGKDYVVQVRVSVRTCCA